jgi:hypothetical protein
MPEATGVMILVHDRGMPVSVNVQTIHPRKLAAVRREVAPGAVGSAWGPAIGKVWPFIRSQSQACSTTSANSVAARLNLSGAFF